MGKNSQGKNAALALGLHALLREALFDDAVMPAALKAGQAGSPPSRAHAVRALSRLSEGELLDCMAKATAHLLRKDKAQAEKNGSPSEMTAVAAAVLATTQADLAGHFILSREFLSAFTKAGIEAVLREAVNGQGEGFSGYWEKQAEGGFKKLFGMKKEEILDAVFARGGYDFKGFVPSCITSCLADNKRQG